MYMYFLNQVEKKFCSFKFKVLCTVIFFRRYRRKFVAQANLLHGCHNDYALSLRNANTHQEHWRDSLLPFCLDTLQQRMELQITEWCVWRLLVHVCLTHCAHYYNVTHCNGLTLYGRLVHLVRNNSVWRSAVDAGIIRSRYPVRQCNFFFLFFNTFSQLINYS